VLPALGARDQPTRPEHDGATQSSALVEARFGMNPMNLLTCHAIADLACRLPVICGVERAVREA